MHTIAILKNTVQNYAWGSLTAIPDLLGVSNPTNIPQAELWMGAHPKAPSEVQYDGQWMSLIDVIEKYPKGNKAPAALLKQGLAFSNIGDTANAKLILQELSRK